MTAETVGGVQCAPSTLEKILDPVDPVGDALDHVASAAFRDRSDHAVGLELEFHLVDRSEPGRRPSWPSVQALVAEAGATVDACRLTLEPGGQVELSTEPARDLAAATAALIGDTERLRHHARRHGLGLAAVGADPARPPARVNPGARYVAMERHFDAVGCGPSGRAMMAATAAFQVNLDAGPRAGWAARWRLLRLLAPVFAAASATSPYLGGRASGWHSMREQQWLGIDRSRTGWAEADAEDPARGWARYALAAPVMMVDDSGSGASESLVAQTQRVSFEAWLRRPALVGRPATRADLDHHLTTLFPPVRPRGYLELRCLDAAPQRWWPALAGLVVTLVEDPIAATEAADVCLAAGASWVAACRTGLADPAVRAAVLGCSAIAAARAEAPVREDVGRLADLLAAGRTPGHELAERIAAVGPDRALLEASDA